MAATAMEASSAEARLTEAKKFEYFSSINSMARKIMQEREKIKDQYGSAWEDMTPVEQDSAIDDGMMEPKIRARYGMHRVERSEVQCYPKLLIQTGQKIVHFGDEDLTWQDEHSAPFSWETKSQLEFSMNSGSSEPVSNSATESKPKTTQSVKLPGIEVSGSARRDEESSFWKLSAERSRLEGEKADFQSLTPSQIKSMEKGEKPLPSYLRNESVSKESQEPAPSRSVKQRVIKPPAPPPPAPISVTPAAMTVTPTPPAPQGGWEKSQSTLPSVSSIPDDVFTPNFTPKTQTEPAKDVEKEESSQAASPTFSQFNTSSNILRTGFDFLDNW
ncbi:uncharacterized protein C1orf198 homolog [Trichomycterus rosablanca]|uniref:uncharacterized protein C1orf198 homolog n=1 Tax=Trichomycterus rosablanca TaxID=2290929 RepID=UPI002F3567D2